MSFKDRLLFRTQVPRSVRRAERVLTGSEWTKRDLIESYDRGGGANRRHALRSRSRLQARTAPAPTAATPSSSAPSSRARTRSCARGALRCSTTTSRLVLVGPEKQRRPATCGAPIQRLRPPATVRTGRPRRTRRAGRALPRRRLPRLSFPLRRLRAAGRRGDGIGNSGRRSDAQERSPRSRATPLCSSSRVTRSRSPAASSGRWPTASDSSQPDSSARAATAGSRPRGKPSTCTGS